MTFSDIRREYRGAPLSDADSDADPVRQFTRWFDQVRDLETDPTAMALATATRAGLPSVRMVLLKDLDERGFVFYTNYGSRKARDIGETGRASLLFYWSSLLRQVRITGHVEKVSEAESDAYFFTRPRESRWSVYASQQSERVESRATLESLFESAAKRYGDDVPRPSWWGGYRVLPDEFEFWQGRPNRLHDRMRYVKQHGGGWQRERLAP